MALRNIRRRESVEKEKEGKEEKNTKEREGDGLEKSHEGKKKKILINFYLSKFKY